MKMGVLNDIVDKLINCSFLEELLKIATNDHESISVPFLSFFEISLLLEFLNWQN